MGGGGGTTVTNTTPPPTPQELALQEKNLQLADIQISALKQQQQFNDKLWTTIGPTFDAQAKLIQQSIDSLPDPNDPAQKARLAGAQEVQDLIQQDTLTRLRAGGGATPQELEALKAAADSAIESGGRDIGRFESDALTQLREQVGPSRGLRPGDTPLTDLGSKILAEGLRARGDLSARVRAGEAAGRLNAPLGAQQLYRAIGELQSALAASSSRFAQDLRESAAMGRLQLAGAYGGFTNNAGQFGLNLATGVPFNGTSAAASLAADRRSNVTQTSTSRPGLLQYAGLGSSAGSLLGGAGGLISGLGLISSRHVKDLLAEYGGAEATAMLEKIAALPIYRWRYNIDTREGDEHVGPVAEDWQKVLGFGPETMISVPDMFGALLLAVKALHDRVNEMAARTEDLEAA